MFQEIIIAMWSGPRNLSTALMRAFENRADCRVWDEPFYAPYLADTGQDHPMTKDICQVCETDAHKVAQACLERRDKTHQSYFYQKHMPHHMLASFDLSWTRHVKNAFLIRDPRLVLRSYLEKRDRVQLEDLGYPQQAALFQRLCEEQGQVPAVIEAEDLRLNPALHLGKLCQALDMPFDDRMLNWPAGPRDSDGPWAAHWYGQVWQSTSIQAISSEQDPRKQLTDSVLPHDLQQIADQAQPFFELLRQHKL